MRFAPTKGCHRDRLRATAKQRSSRIDKVYRIVMQIARPSTIVSRIQLNRDPAPYRGRPWRILKACSITRGGSERSSWEFQPEIGMRRSRHWACVRTARMGIDSRRCRVHTLQYGRDRLPTSTASRRARDAPRSCRPAPRGILPCRRTGHTACWHRVWQRYQRPVS